MFHSIYERARASAAQSFLILPSPGSQSETKCKCFRLLCVKASPLFSFTLFGLLIRAHYAVLESRGAA